MKTPLFVGLMLLPFWPQIMLAQTQDSSFVSPAFGDDSDPQAHRYVTSLTIQPDGKILVFGGFDNVGGQRRTNFVRLNTDGALDDTFNPPATDSDYTQGYILALQTNEKILLGGIFTMVAEQPRTNLALLNVDGPLDSEFNPTWLSTDHVPGSLVVQADGKVLADVYVRDVLYSAALRRFNPDGTLDDGFFGQGVPRGSAWPIAVEADGKILMGRTSSWFFFGEPPLYRLNQDGSLDRAFDLAGQVKNLLVQADGKILIGGVFTNVAGLPQTNIARLNVDGTLDSSFALQSGVSIRSWVALQTDGKMLVNLETPAGDPYGGLARLNADGSVDGSFPVIEHVTGLAMQPDGKILIDGDYVTPDGQHHTGLSRMNNTGAATQRLTCEGSTITWLRGGTSPEVYQTLFESSTNQVDWTRLGEGQRILGGWQLTNIAVRTGSTIRVRGLMANKMDPSDGLAASGGIIEAKLVVGPPPFIVATDHAFGVRSNRFGFNISGLNGQVIVVEASTNLLEWVAAQTNTLTSEPLSFRDTNSWQRSQQFYRVRVQ